MYTLFIPCSRQQHSSGFHHLQGIYQQGAPSFLETGKSLMVPGPNCTEDARRCPNEIAHAARLMSARQYADRHCHNRTTAHESLPLRQDNIKSHWPAEKE